MTVNDLINEVKTGTPNISGVVNTFNVNVDDGMLGTEALKNALTQYDLKLTDHIEMLLLQRNDSALSKVVRELSPR